MFKNNKRGQSLGIVGGLIFGIASLVIGVIIAFVIVGTLDGSGIIPQSSYNEVNESDLTGALVSANTSGYTVVPDPARRNSDSFVLSACWSEYYQSNGTATTTASYGGYNVSLTSANCTLSSAGNLSSGTPLTYNFPNVSASYTFEGDNSQILSAGNLSSNFSEGVDEVADKIPTILLIAAVILILGVLAVLIAVWQRMRMGGGQI